MRIRQIVFLYLVLFFAVLFVMQTATVFAASSPWLQTDWSGGSGQTNFSDVTKYASGSSIFTSTPNQVTLLANTNVGTGNDGAITISANKNLNTDTLISGRSCADGGDAVNYSVTTTVASGSSSLTLASTPASGCLSAGDEILIINLQGTSGNNATVGKYETATIASISGATITFTASLANAYDGTTQKIMVQRVPNYTNVTINGSTTVTASAWNGTKGGVLFFRASGTVTVTGSISMTGKGYAGGASVGNNANGRQGDGYTGAGGSQSTSANGTGGGGGVGTQDSGGGGGGGYSSSGSNGTVSGSHAGGTGGGSVGNTALTTLFFGGGGGSGGGDEDGASSGAGGTGGGIIGINATTLTVSGSITANGNTGSNGVNNAGCGMGGGGGGAGGSLLINATNATLGSSLATATAGGGGSAGGGCGGIGGAGSSGRIAIYSPNSISGTTNPAYNSATITYATSGTLTSSIFDAGFLNPIWGVLTFAASTPSNTAVSVKLRTGSQADLSDATAFSSCSAISSGASVSSNACVGSSARYSQYQLSFSTTDTSTTAAFTSFSLAFASPTPTPTPTVTPTPASGSGASATSTSTGCIATPPAGSPDLYEIDPSTDSATLYFTPVSGANTYAIAYGTTHSVNQFGVSFGDADTSGAVAYTIHSLQSGATYYFRVRADNGCAAGNWSQVSSATTTGQTVSSHPVSGVEHAIAAVIAPQKKLVVTSAKLTAQKSPVCSYTVQSGDSFWRIAESTLGDGTKSRLLQDINAVTDLHPGQELRLPCDKQPATIAKAQQEIKQPGTNLEVKVIAMNNQPVVNALVTLHSKVRMARTDKQGIAHFGDVEKGQHRVLLTYNGYTGEQKLIVDGTSKSQTLTLQVQLHQGVSLWVVLLLGGGMGIVILVLLFLLLWKKKVSLQSNKIS